MKIFLILFCLYQAISQVYQAPIDTVFWFYPGKGQSIGQDSAYFPSNIFSLPDTNASENIPSSSPKHICSIGLGGEIVVGFKDYFVFDGEGVDFTIFENAFVNPITNKIFAEPAVVSVSEDGVNFIDFPWDYYTLEGCAGTKPTNGRANPFDPNVSGGNSFDLAQIGLKKIRYIKIKDICDTILKDTKHPFYDPLLSGFDLDCVVGLHLIPISLSMSEIEKPTSHLYQVFGKFEVNPQPNSKIELFNLWGRCIKTFEHIEYFKTFCDYELSEGLYFVVLISKNERKIFKILKVENELYFQ